MDDRELRGRIERALETDDVEELARRVSPKKCGLGVRSTFDAALDRHPWRPIPGCPGRFKAPGPVDAPPESLLGLTCKAEPLASEKARDRVLVVRFADGGGLISYLRDDGTYLHTLNTAAGLARKLEQLG